MVLRGEPRAPAALDVQLTCEAPRHFCRGKNRKSEGQCCQVRETCVGFLCKRTGPLTPPQLVALDPEDATGPTVEDRGTEDATPAPSLKRPHPGSENFPGEPKIPGVNGAAGWRPSVAAAGAALILAW